MKPATPLRLLPETPYECALAANEQLRADVHRLISERAELVAALREIEATCHPVNTVYSWDERQRKAVLAARAILSKLGEQ